MDETGFVIGMGGNQRVVATNPGNIRPNPSITNRETITIIEAVNGKGDSIAPFIIFQGVQQTASLFENYLPSQAKIVANEESYCTNDLITLQWLEHFESLTKRKQVGQHRLLLLDGHGSHETVEFIQYCWDHKIIPFQLPPHTTHLTQITRCCGLRPNEALPSFGGGPRGEDSGSVSFSRAVRYVGTG